MLLASINNYIILAICVLFDTIFSLLIVVGTIALFFFCTNVKLTASNHLYQVDQVVGWFSGYRPQFLLQIRVFLCLKTISWQKS